MSTTENLGNKLILKIAYSFASVKKKKGHILIRRELNEILMHIGSLIFTE